MTAQASALAKDEFVARFGQAFEASPWVAEAAWDRGLVIDGQTAEGIHRALCTAFRSAPEERRIQVLRAHPDLAGRLAMHGELSPHSAAEQTGAGLDQCSPKELARFTQLNDYYTQHFGFPFIVAVKGKTRAEILDAFEVRATNDPAAEFATACAEVEKIALLRIRDALS